ncbi:hypothetical protein [Roseitranquillus sediminis]|uniref:hypothetical protein n=1 Tax=Roseitranquillus sediminis TaxID=2809051 RepID=UPI001D0C5CCD|nr:hypothetical protein [Roseitranquillus sediminis]MBM9594741.1 hypothetical protein [Roseitranquillus sediminis]
MAELAEIAISLNMLLFREIDALAMQGCASFDLWRRALVRCAVANFCARLAAT